MSRKELISIIRAKFKSDKETRVSLILDVHGKEGNTKWFSSSSDLELFLMSIVDDYLFYRIVSGTRIIGYKLLLGNNENRFYL